MVGRIFKNLKYYLSEGTTIPRRIIFWQQMKTSRVGRAVMIRAEGICSQ